jgi:(S)-2-hydroxy-acid oxidase
MLEVSGSCGKCATQREVAAAQAMGTIFILSTIATSSIEEVAEAAPYGTKWFQLYIYNDRWIVRDSRWQNKTASFQGSD